MARKPVEEISAWRREIALRMRSAADNHQFHVRHRLLRQSDDLPILADRDELPDNLGEYSADGGSENQLSRFVATLTDSKPGGEVCVFS